MKPNKKFSRRKFLGVLGLSAVGTLGYMRWIEPRWLGVGQHSVKLANHSLASPVKVLQLSDLHASDAVPLAFIAKAVRKGLELEPDLVLLTGDFITERFNQFADYAKVLSPLAERTPCFATLGNHDGGAWAAPRGGYADTASVREMLAQSGISLLHNQSAELNIGQNTIHLVGLGDTWAGEFSPATAFSETGNSKRVTTLVLSHNPDTKEELQSFDWDVMFCGHTHGGQLQVPLVGEPFAPVRDKRYVRGLHAWSGRWIHITKGVGNLHGMRLNCRPEISLITLT